MIYRLQKRFILICTVSVLTVIALVFGVILVLNISSMNRNMDMNPYLQKKVGLSPHMLSTRLNFESDFRYSELRRMAELLEINIFKERKYYYVITRT